MFWRNLLFPSSGQKRKPWAKVVSDIQEGGQGANQWEPKINSVAQKKAALVDM
jgi:hypothetical protein